MSSELTSILSICPEESTERIEEYYREHGMIDTVIYLVDNVWDDITRKQADDAIQASSRDTTSKYYQVLFEHFNIKEHFNQVDSHRDFIVKAYEKLQEFVPNMTRHQAEIHDLSKYTFAQSVGYTARWVHMLDNDCWQNSLQDHYCKEPHHPQYYEKKQQKKGDNRPRMEREYLEESLIDMVASHWERQLQGKENPTNAELVDFDWKYFTRYEEQDKAQVLEIVERIKNSPN